MKRLDELTHEERESIAKRNREIFVKELLGEETDGERVDFCYFCLKPFTESQAEFCEKCGTYKCPYCNKCLCDASAEARRILDAEMVSLGIWLNPLHNPPRRKKKRRHGIEEYTFTQSEFLDWVRRNFPGEYANYESGRMSLAQLIEQMEYIMRRRIRVL